MIAAVEAPAEAEGQPLIAGGCPTFEWRPNQVLQNDPMDEEDNGEEIDDGIYVQENENIEQLDDSEPCGDHVFEPMDVSTSDDQDEPSESDDNGSDDSDDESSIYPSRLTWAALKIPRTTRV